VANFITTGSGEVEMHQDIVTQPAYLQWQQDHNLVKSHLRKKQPITAIKISTKCRAINMIALSPSCTLGVNISD